MYDHLCSWYNLKQTHIELNGYSCQVADCATIATSTPFKYWTNIDHSISLKIFGKRFDEYTIQETEYYNSPPLAELCAALREDELQVPQEKLFSK